MLVCRLEHWPRGDQARRKDLGVLHVGLVEQTPKGSHYAAILYGPDGTVLDTGEVPEFPAKGAGPWALAARALDRLVGHQWKFSPFRKGDHKAWKRS